MEQAPGVEKALLVDDIRSLGEPVFAYALRAQAEAWDRLTLTVLQFKILAAICLGPDRDCPSLERRFGILPSTLTRTVDLLAPSQAGPCGEEE